MNIRNHITNQVDLEIYENVDLTNYNSMRLPARGAILATVNTVDGIEQAIAFARRINRPWILLGGGSNVILAEDYIDAVFIRLGETYDFIRNAPDSTLIVGAATPLPRLVDYALRNNLAGFVSLWGIPGTVGGAIAGNAGAAGTSVCARLVYVTILDSKLTVQHLNASEIHWTYRSCDIKDSIILEAGFKTEVEDIYALDEGLTNVRTIRANQPLLGREPSAGCIFKNPQGRYAGRIIEAAGLKGRRIGGAMVSEKHANFIVNTGTARPQDVMSLIDVIQTTVTKRFNVTLEPEVKFICSASSMQRVG